jgi:hypothetical protein
MKHDAMDLTPEGEPPTVWARWCPSCRLWVTHINGRRRCWCGAAVVRLGYRPRHREPGELRPGVVAEFDDPRDQASA